jgi:hypothetical protein
MWVTLGPFTAPTSFWDLSARRMLVSRQVRSTFAVLGGGIVLSAVRVLLTIPTTAGPMPCTSWWSYRDCNDRLKGPQPPRRGNATARRVERSKGRNGPSGAATHERPPIRAIRARAVTVMSYDRRQLRTRIPQMLRFVSSEGGMSCVGSRYAPSERSGSTVVTAASS